MSWRWLLSLKLNLQSIVSVELQWPPNTTLTQLWILNIFPPVRRLMMHFIKLNTSCWGPYFIGSPVTSVTCHPIGSLEGLWMSCSVEGGHESEYYNAQYPQYVYGTDTCDFNTSRVKRLVFSAHLVLFTLHREVLFNEDTVCEMQERTGVEKCHTDSSKGCNNPHVQANNGITRRK